MAAFEKIERAALNLSQGKKPGAPIEASHPSKGAKSSKEDDNSKPTDPSEEPQPEGGHDDTPLPAPSGPTYMVKITFHSATHLPVADFDNMSADPFIRATLTTSLPTRHKEDPPIQFRTRTEHGTRDPQWEESWILGGVPESGFDLKCKLFDEDVADHDDRLGVAKLSIPAVGGPGWRNLDHERVDIKARRSGTKQNVSRLITHIKHRKEIKQEKTEDGVNHYEVLIVSVEVLGRTPKDSDFGKVYTAGPHIWRVHYSPLIGRMMGMKGPKELDMAGLEQKGQKPAEGQAAPQQDGKQKDGQGEEVQYFDFQANELQLQGPVPNELYHRFVNFKSFVPGMFQSTGLRGRLLNKALHHQHARLYNFDKRTVYGHFDEPGQEMTKKFLDMAHWDQGGRVFTYVVTSDALLRFTETGKEFGIDLLSKHTMHSDVNIYIAWSGEFLIRRRAKEHGSPSDGTHPPNPLPDGPPEEESPSNPALYELIIDNDSGTYRPLKELIPIFQSFLERSLPGMHIKVYDGFDEELKKIKDQQREAKKKEGNSMAFVQDEVKSEGSSASSMSSSDEEDLARRAEDLKVEE